MAKLDEALARTEEGRLRVAMLGQFKRGKSTLLNALLGVPLLPTGITPVTAIPTYVHAASSPLLRIEFEGSRKPLESARARRNSQTSSRGTWRRPRMRCNREQVRSVEIALNSVTFSDRVVLVDTPGVGSTFLHNSRTAEAVLSDCDVGIFVLSPDPPITEVELGYLDNVQRLIPKVYFALNKVDLLSPDERDVALVVPGEHARGKARTRARAAHISGFGQGGALRPSERETEPRSPPAECWNWSRLSRTSWQAKSGR